MLSERSSDGTVPRVAFAAVTRCPRVGGVLLSDASVDIWITLGSASLVYRDRDRICRACGNRIACAKQAEQLLAPRREGEVSCPQSGPVPIPLTEARGMWAGEENPQCAHCSNHALCLPPRL